MDAKELEQDLILENAIGNGLTADGVGADGEAKEEEDAGAEAKGEEGGVAGGILTSQSMPALSTAAGEKSVSFDPSRDQQQSPQQSAPSDEETRLNALFARVEVLQGAMDSRKQACADYVTGQCEGGGGVVIGGGRSMLDELYLYFKSKVHHASDLQQEEQAVVEFVYERLQAGEATYLMPMLLEWLLVEQELLALQQIVQKVLMGELPGGAPALGVVETKQRTLKKASSWVRRKDEASGEDYFYHPLTSESRWDEPPPLEFVQPDLQASVYWLRSVFTHAPSSPLAEMYDSDEKRLMAS
jgi:hypothetical protein